MIFLIPLLIVIAIVFGIDHYYFADENAHIVKDSGVNHQEKLKNAQNYLKSVLKDERER